MTEQEHFGRWAEGKGRMNEKTNIVSISGGKDSAVTGLLAGERRAQGLRFVYADTGHEHPVTEQYVEYLSDVFQGRFGVGIETVRADFSERFAKKRQTIREKWPEDGVPQAHVDEALALMQPTGIPMLDLCMLRGRFPSTRARFCTEELKILPMQKRIVMPAIKAGKEVTMWVGVRRDESRARANAEVREWTDPGYWLYRPIASWSAQDVFDYHREKGIDANPLYMQGMSRVGCMPCIMARKGELRQIAARWPEHFDRLAQWEKLIAAVSKWGKATFFSSDKTPGEDESRSNAMAVKDWARTGRGGKQFDLFADEAPACSSVYGLCE